MKFYVDSDIDSIGIQRVVTALIDFAPDWVEITDSIAESDVVVYHINGRRDSFVRKILRNKKPYAVVQYSYKSTKNPHAKDWQFIWNSSLLVWSYLELPLDEYFYSPLGLDANFLLEDNNEESASEEEYIICSTGLSYLSESVRECIIAANGLGLRPAHLGTDLGRDNVDSFFDISDKQVANVYKNTKFVSGLRRDEGFEFPVIEGLYFGARPIVFNRSHYREMFGDLAVYIPEGDRAEVIESLKDIFMHSGEYLPVTREEKQAVLEDFDWADIIPNFYSEVYLSYYNNELET